MKRIGMRNIKTAIAVFLSVLIANLFDLESSFYAAIAAVISMQSSVTSSYKAGKNRMLGTFTGALIGLIFSLISPENIFLCGLGIIIVIYICNLLEWHKSITIGCIVFIAIMTNLDGESPWFYSSFRLIDTFTGITISVLVNNFICHPKYKTEILTYSNTIKNTIFSLFEEKLFNNKDMNLIDLKKDISALESTLDKYIAEFNPKKTLNIENTKNLIKKFNKIYDHFIIINSLEKKVSLNKDNYNKLSKIYKNYTSFENNYETNELNIVFNYHVSKVISLLENLTCENLSL